MKKCLLLPIFFAILLSSCREEKAEESFTVGLEEQFQHGKINKSAKHSLQFSITEINDSRCPSDVVCIWEGKADVRLSIESPQKGEIVLSTYNNLVDTFANYSFTLIDVSPYPVSTKTIELEDYTVLIKIEEIQD